MCRQYLDFPRTKVRLNPFCFPPSMRFTRMKPWPFPRRTRILAVDDEVGFTRLLKLAASHYDIRTENDPARAIEAAKEFQPHLILLDRYMPGMSGDSLARTLKE